MNKREFLRKSAFLSASVIGIPASAVAKRPLDNTNSNHADLPAPVKLVIGSDHAGFHLKGPLIKLLQSWNHIVKDVGSFTPDPVDFPDIALLLAEEVLSGRAEKGVMVCGTGVGAAIACNKIHGIRAALCHDTYSAHQCVEHDNVNVLCLGAQIIGISVAEEILSNYLRAEFSTEEQFRRRVQKLNQFDVVQGNKK